jgi:hypothetical protein
LCENLTFIGYLCEICSMCENMAICVKIWLHSIFVWNILNVWKYGHLWKKLTFIGYLCEICSIWDNMAIWCLGSISDAMCAVSEALYSVSDGCYTESSNCSVSDEQKGRHTLTRRISHMRKRATHVMGACLPFTKHAQKRMSMNYCPRCASCTSTRHGHLHMCVCTCTNGHAACRIMKHDMEHKLFEIFKAFWLPWN